MHIKLRLTVLAAMAALAALAASLALAQEAPEGPEVAACLPGGGYDPACDVNQNGVIDVVDIQLAAGHWNQSGVFTSGSWDLTGNAGTTPGAHFVGTTDNQPLELRVNSQRALRLEPYATSPTWWAATAATASLRASMAPPSAAVAQPPAPMRSVAPTAR